MRMLLAAAGAESLGESPPDSPEGDVGAAVDSPEGAMGAAVGTEDDPEQHTGETSRDTAAHSRGEMSDCNWAHWTL